MIIISYIVYKHTTPSNKVYIGITSQQATKRWQNGRGYIQNPYFSRAIAKYGWNHIKHEILYTNLSKEEACSLEIELIAKYNSNDYRYGYNISRGGEAGMSKAVCKYSLDGKLLAEYPTAIEASIRENIDAHNICICCRGRTNSSGGFVWRYNGDTFKKYFDVAPRITKTGKLFSSIRNSDYIKMIYKYDKSGNLLETYNSAYDIPDINTKQRACIIRCCNKKIKTSMGYVWRFNEEDNIVDSIVRKQSSSSKRVSQYDKNGNLIKIWDSISEAKQYYNSSNIDAVLCGKRHIACGFVWRYENDNFNKYGIHKKKSNRKRKYDNMPVYQYDRNGNYIRKYDSVYDINKQDFVYGNVIKCLLGRISYTNGYVFTFIPREVDYEN